MKFLLLGLTIILFGIAIMIAYSTTGYAYKSGTTFGLTISSIGLIISVVSFLLTED